MHYLFQRYNYSIVYVEDKQKSTVYKRFANGTWMRLSGNVWTAITTIERLEKLFKEKKSE